MRSDSPTNGHANRTTNGRTNGGVNAQASGGAPPRRRLAAAALENADRHLRDLPDAELLGLLLAGGRTRADAIRLAREILAVSGSLAALPGSSRPLLRHHGLRDAQVSAALANRRESF
jgi:DNA repair protein RadC